MASRPKRDDGPWRPMIAASSPRPPKTGAAPRSGGPRARRRRRRDPSGARARALWRALPGRRSCGSCEPSVHRPGAWRRRKRASPFRSRSRGRRSDVRPWPHSAPTPSSGRSRPSRHPARPARTASPSRRSRRRAPGGEAARAGADRDVPAPCCPAGRDGSPAGTGRSPRRARPIQLRRASQAAARRCWR